MGPPRWHSDLSHAVLRAVQSICSQARGPRGTSAPRGDPAMHVRAVARAPDPSLLALGGPGSPRDLSANDAPSRRAFDHDANARRVGFDKNKEGVGKQMLSFGLDLRSAARDRAGAPVLPYIEASKSRALSDDGGSFENEAGCAARSPRRRTHWTESPREETVSAAGVGAVSAERPRRSARRGRPDIRALGNGYSVNGSAQRRRATSRRGRNCTWHRPYSELELTKILFY